MADDLGWGDVGFNGNTTILTPGLDRMAAEGIILNRMYAATPVSSPSSLKNLWRSKLIQRKTTCLICRKIRGKNCNVG